MVREPAADAGERLSHLVYAGTAPGRRLRARIRSETVERDGEDVDQNDQTSKKPESTDDDTEGQKFNPAGVASRTGATPSDDDTEGQKFNPTGVASRTGVTPSDEDDDTEGHKMSRT